jgi:hypothetical protein
MAAFAYIIGRVINWLTSRHDNDWLLEARKQRIAREKRLNG